jgi:hypothetical protein
LAPITENCILIAKFLVSGAIVLAPCVGSAVPAYADPSVFGVLSCGCQEAAPPGSPARMQNVNKGIQQGLASVTPAAPVQ